MVGRIRGIEDMEDTQGPVKRAYGKIQMLKIQGMMQTKKGRMKTNKANIIVAKIMKKGIELRGQQIVKKADDTTQNVRDNEETISDVCKHRGGYLKYRGWDDK